VKSFKFVHTADLHLDSPFGGISEVDEHVGERLREATFETFDRIINLCLEHDVAFLLVAGDVYDGKDRSLRAQLRFRDGLIKLSKAGISTFVVHGNHDPLDSRIATIQWPEQAHVFEGNRVTYAPVIHKNKIIAHVYGISYPTQDVQRNLAKEFRRQKDSPFAIGLLHCNVGRNPGHEPYAPCTIEDLISAGMDYWALGHIHKHAVLSVEKPTVIYAGNPQGLHPGELESRGCYLVEVSNDGHCTPKFIPVDSVRWFSKEVNIEGFEDDEAIIASFEDACSSIRDESKGIPAVCRILFVGRGPAHHSLNKPGFVEDLTRRARETEGNQNPFLWVERIQIETSSPLNIEALAKGEDFVADFLNLAAERRSDPAFLAEVQRNLANLFGSRLGRSFLEPLGEDKLLHYLDAAQTRCLDLLTAERD